MFRAVVVMAALTESSREKRITWAVVVDHKNGRLRFEWQHGGESELVFAWPQDDTV